MLSTDLMLASILTWSFSDGTPIYKEVLINATTKISCFPNEDIQIQWHHTAPTRSSYHLYAGGRFFSSSNRGFRLEKDSNTGPYHIVIPHARTEDAGLYECKEDGIGSRLFGLTHLTVLESNPVCGSNMRPDGYVGPTTCRLTQENMTFTCAVSFKGQPPQLRWTTLNGSQSFNSSTCKTETDRINCSLIVRTDSKYDGSIFNCQLRDASVNCSTEVIKIHYFEDQTSPVLQKNMGDKVNCSVKSNQEVEYKWTRLEGIQYANYIDNQELVIRNHGLYRCEVKYRIRNLKCFALASEVKVNNTTPTYCETDQGKIDGLEVNALNPNTTQCAPAKCSRGTKGTAGTTVIISVLVTTLVIIMFMTGTNLGPCVHVKG